MENPNDCLVDWILEVMIFFFLKKKKPNQISYKLKKKFRFYFQKVQKMETFKKLVVSKFYLHSFQKGYLFNEFN